MIYAIPPSLIRGLWPQMEKFLKPVIAKSYGEVTLDGIYSRLLDGTEIAVGVFDTDMHMVAVCILGISEFETGKRVLQMPYCGGVNMTSWLQEGFKVIKQIAKEQNCTHIRGCGRPGWEKALPELKKIRTVYECEV